MWALFITYPQPFYGDVPEDSNAVMKIYIFTKGWLQLKILVVTTKTGGRGVGPTTKSFVIFLPGSDQLLSNFVIFFWRF